MLLLPYGFLKILSCVSLRLAEGIFRERFRPIILTHALLRSIRYSHPSLLSGCLLQTYVWQTAAAELVHFMQPVFAFLCPHWPVSPLELCGRRCDHPNATRYVGAAVTI